MPRGFLFVQSNPAAGGAVMAFCRKSLLIFAVAACWPAVPAWSQQPVDEVAATRTQPPAAEPGREPRFRKLAPGVEITIDPAMQANERFSRHDLDDLLAADPQYGERPWSDNLARNVRFQHDIWALEFTFKPVRFVDIDMPGKEVRFERKKIWYLVYRVTNRGQQPQRFLPRVLLHCWDTNKWYPERLVPLAVPRIQRREDPARPLLNSVEIGDVEVLPAQPGQDNSVWGVFTWEDVDPRTDRFSIYIQGLTNAYRWEQKDGKTRTFRKTLQLNFWRPGDELFEHESEIRFGMPEGGMSAGLIYNSRQRANLSLDQLAAQAGVPAAELAAWEKGTSPIPLDRVPALRAALSSHVAVDEVDYRWVYK